MLQVGKHYNKEKKPFTYKYVKVDNEGWADVKKFLPRNYDLVYLKIGDKIKMGWYSGFAWDGYKLKPKECPQFWKRKEEDEDYGVEKRKEER